MSGVKDALRLREYSEADFAAVKRLHEASGLPGECLADFANPLFFVREVAERAGRVEQAVFLKIQGEAFLLVDHDAGTPEERWTMLRALAERGFERARGFGIEQVSAWLPPEIEKSFGRRIKELGFERSRWMSWTKNLWDGQGR